METINNMANAAAKAVWGENGTQREPISGANGDVTKGEPYDAGNLETPYQERMENTLGASHTTETANTAASTTTPSAAPSVPTAEPSTSTSTSTPAARPSETHAVAPSRTENAAYASTEDAETQNKKEEEGILDPSELKGAGPRPLEVLAKENGGNANAGSGSSSEKRENNLGNAGEENLTGSTGHGTGEQYVKSTGLTADGGDFDATNPGAGKEADRLLEEKGVHRDSGVAQKESSASTDSHQKDKPSLGQRIKAKLHKH
jgi:hypothetical protein